MLVRLSAAWDRLRRRFGRSHLTARLLNNLRPAEESGRPGAVAIQIDGLGRSQLEAALRNGRMPFLRARVQSEETVLRTFYPGMPSTTPAVQSELFFGVRQAVPAFGYVRRADGRPVRLMNPLDVDRLAADLARNGKEPLLAEGAAYGDILTGGSSEARYCTQTLELESFWRVVNPVKTILILLLHATTVLRLAGYLLVEIGLAIYDAVQGIFARRSFFGELKFIPMRVAVCIGLRELVRFRVKNDLIRGIPLIHANFIGYDEQAHRRGPSSAFAHWSLKGIDGAIQDIVRSAERSPFRDYRVVIYSDHGQEDVESYRRNRGESVADAAGRVLGGGKSPKDAGDGEAAGPEYRRRRAGSLLRGDGDAESDPAPRDGIERIMVSAIGPLGHVYLPGEGTEGGSAIRPEFRGDLEAAGRALVKAAEIPLVLFRDGETARAVTPAGVFSLKEEAEQVLGADHPLRDLVAADLAALCDHPDAGDLVISGWRPTGRPLTFPVENGAHGGPGAEESRGFILFPRALDPEAEPVRPLDLRRVLQERIGRERVGAANRTSPSAIDGPAHHAARTGRDRSSEERPSDALRVVTYNIHGCRTLDGRVGTERIAEVLAELDPDLVALQEVDVGQARSHGRDQAAELGAALGMHAHFFPVLRKGPACYGLAVLSRPPFLRARNTLLPGPPGPGRERRGAIRITVAAEGGGEFDLINTHLGLGLLERRRQAAALLSDGWLRDGVPAALCGDFNAGPGSPVCRRLGERLRPAGNGKPTFFAKRPLLRLDHIFVTDSRMVLAAGVASGETARRASDHLPAWADLRPNGESS
ncbi:MAG: endonuclease/exonuclease/phosphatase family protein [Desulfococcaceae bacterium]